jgi:hypothetical protein
MSDNSIIKCIDNIELLSLIICSDIDPELLNDSIRIIGAHKNIISVINNKKLWKLVNPEKVPLEFVFENIRNIKKIPNLIYIKLIEKYGTKMSMINWILKYIVDDEYCDLLAETLIKYNLLNWNIATKKFHFSEKFIEKHEKDIPFNLLIGKYKFSENFLLKYGNKISWGYYRGNIPQKVFEKYPILIGKNYRKKFILTEENFEKYIIYNKYIFRIKCNFDMFEKLLSKKIKINFNGITFFSIDDYSKLFDDKYIKIINNFNFNTIAKKYNIEEKYIYYLIDRKLINILVPIIYLQQLSDDCLKKCIEKFDAYSLKISIFDVDIVQHILKNQILSEQFINKYIKLNKKNKSLILQFQSGLSPEFFERNKYKKNIDMLKHNYSDNFKINLIKTEKLNANNLIYYKMRYTENIINYILSCKIKCETHKYLTEIKYNNDNFEYINILTGIIGANILWGYMLDYIHERVEKFIENLYILMLTSNKIYDYNENINYIIYKYFSNIFINQMYVSDNIFKKLSLFMKKISQKRKNKLLVNIFNNKKLYVNVYCGKILNIQPRLKSRIFDIKKFRDIVVHY